MNREEILSRLNKTLSNGDAIIGAGCSAGIVAKCAELGGADLIVCYSTGKSRIMGLRTEVIGHSNPRTLEMYDEISNVVNDTPIIAGIEANDQTTYDLNGVIDRFVDQGFDFVGPADIVMMPSIVDVAGINRINGRVYASAAAAIVGMVRSDAPVIAEDKPLVTASMFGNTTPCIDHARSVIERQGFEVLVFHATGIGGRTMENLISEGYIAASLDVTMTELADEACGGGASAGPDRGLAASCAGIPTVMAPGCVDMANFGPLESVPEKYRQRTLYQWAPTATLLRTNEEENRRIGDMIAAAANEAIAPIAILLPLKGVSMLDSDGGAFWDPAANAACFDAIKSSLRQDIPVIELAYNINDQPFAEAAADTLLNLMRQSDNYRVKQR